MITSKLTGNIGNNLFQYCITRIIAEHNNYDWGISFHTDRDYFNGIPQTNFLNIDYGKNIDLIDFKEYHEQTKYIFSNENIFLYDKNIMNIADNSKLVGYWQHATYYENHRNKIMEWISVKDINKIEYENKLKELDIVLDNNTCVINFRGGEYKNSSLKDVVLLIKQYWRDSINHMLLLNPNMKFLVITDDSECAKEYMPFDIPCYHISIGGDYFVINNAKWLILSNSSFAWFPAFLNKSCNKIIVPKYWSRYNTSDGYWVNNLLVSNWECLDRNGILQDYTTVKNELNTGKYNGLFG